MSIGTDDKGQRAFTCFCGNTEPIVMKPKEIAEKESKHVLEDYNFANKRCSRKIIARYLLELRHNDIIPEFSEQKVLILTHVEGYDFKEILHPLGYVNDNITIVEREKEVFNKIKKNSLFNGCDIVNSNLEEFKTETIFDLVYLDFKSNISYDVLFIIRELIMRNTHVGTVFYINLQMAREISDVVNIYSDLEKELNRSYDAEIKKQREELKDIEGLQQLMEIMLGMKKLKNIPDSPFGDVNIQMLFNGEKMFIDEQKLFGLRETFKKMKESMLKPVKEKNYKKKLEERNNFHVLRQKFLKVFVKWASSIYLRNPEMYVKDLAEDLPEHNINFDLRQSENTEPIIRYLSQSLFPLYIKQFIYRNPKGSPFLNSLFFLTNEKDLLNKYGFVDFSEYIFNALQALCLFEMNIYKIDNLIQSIDNFVFVREKMRGKSNETSARESDKKSIEIMQNLIDLYKYLSELDIIQIYSNGGFQIKLYDTRFKTVEYKGSYDPDSIERIRRSLMRKDKFLDASLPILRLYLIDNLLHKLEEQIGITHEIDDCIIIEVEDSEDLNTYLDRRFKHSFKKLPLLMWLRDYSRYLVQYAKEMVVYKRDMIEKSKTHASLKKIIKNLGNETNCLIKGCADLVNFEKLKKLKIIHSITKKKQKEKNNESESKKEGENNMAEKTITKEDLKEIVYDHIENNPKLKSREIADMVMSYIKTNYDKDIEVTDCMVRAWKFWYKRELRGEDYRK